MNVIELDSKHYSDYQTFLHSIDKSLIYYTVSYKGFIQELLGCKSQYWVVVENDQITGVLPSMEMKGPHGRVINSLPYYGSNGGVLATTITARNALCEKYNRVVRERGVAAATFVTHPLMPIHGSLVAHDFVDERIGQFTLLTNEGDAAAELLERLDGSTRRNIRKAEKSNVVVHIDNKAIGFLEDIHRENMADIGGKAKSEKFFELLPKHFLPDEQYRIYVAEIEGELVAALLIFYFNKTVEYFTPVTRKEHRSAQPMAKILFEAMVDAATRGFRWWNWGGTWISQEGVYRFKRKWAADDFRYSYYVKVNNTDILASSESGLLQSYSGFFVVPFDRLNSQSTIQNNE